MKCLLKSFVLLALLLTLHSHAWAQPKITWDSKSLLVDGRRVVPVMGEIHYSRLPENEWEAAVKNMKAGGVTMIATYTFWNHVEELEDQWDWSGRRNLRRFLEICKQEQMPVILRLGPFCHGEVRNGGIPDWFFTKGIKSRCEDLASWPLSRSSTGKSSPKCKDCNGKTAVLLLPASSTMNTAARAPISWR